MRETQKLHYTTKALEYNVIKESKDPNHEIQIIPNGNYNKLDG
jgi:hypothetical protein